MSANGISGLSTKEERQLAKLEYSQAKRRGQVITEGSGAWSADGIDNLNVNWYRSNNTYDITTLPDTYNGNIPGPDDNPNTGGLVPKRPWVAVSAIAEPTSIEESIDGDTLINLQIWYDGTDIYQFTPKQPADEGLITQWSDKSNQAHNANPSGGNNAKPSYESSDLQNTHEYVEFDGSDNLNINPFSNINATSSFTIFVAAKFTNASGTEYLVDTTTGDFGIYSDNGTIKLTMNGYAATTNQTVVAGEWKVHTLVYNGSAPSLLYRLNKTSAGLTTVDTVPSQTGATTVMTLGNNNAKTAGLTGAIGEVIMFDKVLNSTEYSNVENYLKTKWNI